MSLKIDANAAFAATPASSAAASRATPSADLAVDSQLDTAVSALDTAVASGDTVAAQTDLVVVLRDMDGPPPPAPSTYLSAAVIAERTADLLQAAATSAPRDATQPVSAPAESTSRLDLRI